MGLFTFNADHGYLEAIGTRWHGDCGRQVLISVFFALV